MPRRKGDNPEIVCRIPPLLTETLHPVMAEDSPIQIQGEGDHAVAGNGRCPCLAQSGGDFPHDLVHIDRRRGPVQQRERHSH